MRARKSKSKQFLQAPDSAFILVTTLVLHHYLCRVSVVAFKQHDADRSDLPQKPSETQQKAANRRLRFKGAQALSAPHEDPNRKYTMIDIFDSGLQAVWMFWNVINNPHSLHRSMFALCEMFWPANLPKSDMLWRLTEDVLKTIAGLKWRFVTKGKAPPYNLLALADPDCPDNIQKGLFASFCALPNCCLDQWWGKPVRQDMDRQEDQDAQLLCLKKHVAAFARNARAVSSREESLHKSQRYFAGGWVARAPTFAKQSAQVVLETSMTHYSRRTGVSKRGASAGVKRAAKVVQKGKVQHCRPRHWGNPMFTFINDQRRAGSELTFSDLKRQWVGMPAPEKQEWSRKQRLTVSTRRWAKRSVQTAAAAEETEDENRSPWNLGNDSVPLRPEFLSDFLKPFQKRASGLDALQPSDCLEAQVFRQQVRNGCRKYHSIDAAVYGARALLMEPITNKQANGPPWQNVAECPKPEKCCKELHPGLCRTLDELDMPVIAALEQAFPRKNGVFMVEHRAVPVRDRVVIFARLVVGLILH